MALGVCAVRLGAILSRGFTVSAAPHRNKPAIMATIFVSPITGGLVKKIEVVENDITRESVDVIVNAANSWLKHGGGLAAAIVRNGGIQIQEESDEYVSKHGPVSTGDVAVTGSGTLPCKAIIHAVGPVWKGGIANENNNLRSAVLNSLEECHKREYASISIPAISSGIFGFPIDQCAEILFAVTIEFLRSKPNTSLQLVRFTNFDVPTVEVFQECAARNTNKPGVKVELHSVKSKL